MYSRIFIVLMQTNVFVRLSFLWLIAFKGLCCSFPVCKVTDFTQKIKRDFKSPSWSPNTRRNSVDVAQVSKIYRQQNSNQPEPRRQINQVKLNNNCPALNDIMNYFKNLCGVQAMLEGSGLISTSQLGPQWVSLPKHTRFYNKPKQDLQV